MSEAARVVGVCRGTREAREHAADFVFADVEEVGDAVVGEDFVGADAAEVTPVVAVRSGADGCVVVGDVFGRELERAAREDEVVLAGEGFLGE